jgi:hypothetical protein
MPVITKEIRDAAAEHGKKFAQALPEIGATMDQQQGMLQAIMDDIGMDHSLSLQVAGMHLGSIIGGGCDLGIEPKRWPDALISLYSGGEWERWLIEGDDMACAHGVLRKEYVGAVKDIARACMPLVDRCIVLTVPDHAKAMRQYLDLLSTLVGQAAFAAQGH